MPSSDYKPCAGPSGPWCKTMSWRLDQEATTRGRQALAELILTSAHTGTERLAGVFHKAWVRDRGVMLNYCPFCGTRIAPYDESPKETDRDA